MINTLVFEAEPQSLTILQKHLSRYCPYIKVAACQDCLSTAPQLIGQINPELIFVNPDLRRDPAAELNKLSANYCEIIFLSAFEKSCFDLIKNTRHGFILKPIQSLDFILAVNHALNRIIENKDQQQRERLSQRLINLHIGEEVIAIPTIEGYEFLPVNQIIRCEGLQKCTHVILLDKPSMVSSYNLGEFIKLLEPYGFSSPHRSHLINLNRMVRYHREGTITMLDGGHVPVSRRRKEAFLEAVIRF